MEEKERLEQSSGMEQRLSGGANPLPPRPHERPRHSSFSSPKAFDSEKTKSIRKSSLPADPIYVPPRPARGFNSRRKALTRYSSFSPQHLFHTHRQSFSLALIVGPLSMFAPFCVKLGLEFTSARLQRMSSMGRASCCWRSRISPPWSHTLGTSSACWMLWPSTGFRQYRPPLIICYFSDFFFFPYLVPFTFRLWVWILSFLVK